MPSAAPITQGIPNSPLDPKKPGKHNMDGLSGCRTQITQHFSKVS